jgi:hypothetical protein
LQSEFSRARAVAGPEPAPGKPQIARDQKKDIVALLGKGAAEMAGLQLSGLRSKISTDRVLSWRRRSPGDRFIAA